MFGWVVRAAWAVLPVAAGPGLGDALSSRSEGVRAAASVGLWAVWGVVMLATLVPLPVSLTALRVVAPLGFGWALWSRDGLAVAACGLAVVAAFAPATGMLFVNGSAYPNERRFCLRAPGALLAGLLPLAWALAVGPVMCGVLFLAAGVVAWGVVVLVVGVVLAVVLLRALHSLSRRWLVFVPAGVVLHDPLSLVDPVLFQRRVIEVMRLAPADTDALDLTQRSPGLAVELVLREKVPMALVRPGQRGGEQGSSARLMFTPTRPGAVLAAARDRRLAE